MLDSLESLHGKGVPPSSCAPAIGWCPLATDRTLRRAFPGGTEWTRAAGSCRGLHAAGLLVRRGASSAGFVAACSGNIRLGRFGAHRPRLGEEHRGRQDTTILSDHIEILRVLEISRRPLRQVRPILGDRLGRHDVLCRLECKEEVYLAACTFRAAAAVCGVVSPRDFNRVRGAGRSGVRKLSSARQVEVRRLCTNGYVGLPPVGQFRRSGGESAGARRERTPRGCPAPVHPPIVPKPADAMRNPRSPASDAKSMCDDVACNASPGQGIPRRNSRPQDTASFAWRTPFSWTGDGFRPVCGEGREPTRLKPPHGRG